ncbi:MAG: hypothetical protein J6A47_02055 [Bacilli bacterium]|nr:hypothetical protein [Bacilli bacterium]
MTIEEQNEYVRRINLVINRDKSWHLESHRGWQIILDKFEIQFASNIVKVDFHLIEGQPVSEKFDNRCKAGAIKGLLELFNQHYYYIVPKGYMLMFLGSGIYYSFRSSIELRKAIDKCLDIMQSYK